MKEAFLLHNALVPYMYTYSREAYDTGVSLVHPIYYEFPIEENAYAFTDTQYMLGKDLIVSPISSTVNPDSLTIT